MRTRTRAVIEKMKIKQLALCMAAPLMLVACGGGGSGSASSTTPDFNVEPLGTQSLSAPEVNDIVARAVQASISRGVQSTIAVTDRV
ncbi:MAG: hypothetical protein Q8M35_05755, partial [Pseudohongiella sp.]|nr:hypothetical protein [Pseudohongiella sp.]